MSTLYESKKKLWLISVHWEHGVRLIEGLLKVPIIEVLITLHYICLVHVASTDTEIMH